MIKKQYGYTASVVTGTNKVVACSRANWSPIRVGSFIIFNGDDAFYKVSDKRKFTVEKVATASSSDTLEIGGNVGTLINTDDDITITYDEWEASTCSVTDGGAGYSVGDFLKPQGGVCKYNAFDEIDAPTILEVTEVDGNGAVVSVSINSKGVYLETPDAQSDALHGTGNDCVLDLTYEQKNDKSSENRSVSGVELTSDKTIISLNNALPPRIKNVTIRAEKWELSLAINYTKPSKFNSAYEIVKDFTPNCDLPLMYSNFSSNYLTYNESMSILDQRIKDLENKLGM